MPLPRFISSRRNNHEHVDMQATSEHNMATEWLSAGRGQQDSSRFIRVAQSCLSFLDNPEYAVPADQEALEVDLGRHILELAGRPDIMHIPEIPGGKVDSCWLEARTSMAVLELISLVLLTRTIKKGGEGIVGPLGFSSEIYNSALFTDADRKVIRQIDQRVRLGQPRSIFLLDDEDWVVGEHPPIVEEIGGLPQESGGLVSQANL